MSIKAISVQDSVSKGLAFNGHDNETKRRGVSRYAAPVAATMLALTPAQTGAVSRGDMFVPEKEPLEYLDTYNTQRELPQSVGDTIGNLAIQYFAKGDFKLRYNVRFVNRNNNPYTFEKAYFCDEVVDGGVEKMHDTRKEIGSLGFYNVSIMSDDKSIANTFEYGYLDGTDGKSLFDGAEKLNPLKEVFVSDRNNSNVNVVDESVVLVPDYRNKSYIVANAASRRDEMKSAPSVDCSSLNKAGEDVLEGNNGKYKLSYYSKKGGDKIVLITVKKDGYPELALADNYLVELRTEIPKLEDKDIKSETVKTAMIVVVDRNHKPYVLCDRTLADALGQIYLSDMVAPDAFNCDVVKRFLALRPNSIDGKPTLYVWEK